MSTLVVSSHSCLAGFSAELWIGGCSASSDGVSSSIGCGVTELVDGCLVVHSRNSWSTSICTSFSISTGWPREVGDGAVAACSSRPIVSSGALSNMSS